MNLGLVELGGYSVPDVKFDGYVFRFNSKEPEALKIRGYANLMKVFNENEDIHEVRLFVNYDDPVTLATGMTLLWMLSYKYDDCYIIFKDGRVVTL